MRISRKRWLALAGAALIASTTVFAVANAYADPGGTITGHVLDNGVPVSDVTVQIFVEDGSVFVPEVTTDANGAFTLANVPPAAYRVSYRLPGGNTFYANSATTIEASDLIVVADGATVTLDEAVPPHGAIHGRLSRADGSGVFAFVQALSATGSAFTTTDPNGNYSMPYVWEGTYRVQFTPTGAPEQYAHQKTDFLSARVQSMSISSRAKTFRGPNELGPFMDAGMPRKSAENPLERPGLVRTAGAPFSSTSGSDGRHDRTTYHLGGGSYDCAARFPGGVPGSPRESETEGVGAASVVARSSCLRRSPTNAA